MIDKLLKIQQQLKVPKDLYNKFGNYSYRSCETILEALKPLLKEEKATLTISDEVIEVGGSVYVKATATLSSTEGKSVSTTAYAREATEQKGMSSSQITGAASSYARKYALNGLFCIDDTKDADATNVHGNKHDDTDQSEKPLQFGELVNKMETATNVFELKNRWQKYANDMRFCTEEERVKISMAKDKRKLILEKEKKNDN